MSLFVDFHALQSVPVANLNRDDLGSPKIVKYGNASRLRVSSQSWKRVIRQGVEAELGEKAARTRLVPIKVAEALSDEGWPKELAVFAGAQVAVSATAKALKVEAAGHTSVLLFLPESGIAELAALCREHRDELEAGLGKKNPGALLPSGEVGEILKRRTASISLLGRMLAELPGANVDGAAQVAHAFTTHAAEPQRDYFTAVDDWLPAEATGSGHLNTAEFGAGVFYRFASVNVTDLIDNLEGDDKIARSVLSSFAEQFIMSLPQAKKNSTAPHTVPDLAYLAVRRRRPLSLAAAFETPVTADEAGGFSVPSRQALAAYARDVHRLTGDRHCPFHGHAAVGKATFDDLGETHPSFDGLIEAAVEAAFADQGAAR